MITDLLLLRASGLLFISLELINSSMMDVLYVLLEIRRDISDSRWLTIKCSMLSLVRLELFTLSMASFRASSCSESLRRRETTSSLRD